MLVTATITGSYAPTIHLGAQTYTEKSAGESIIGGQTLTKGGEISAGGTPVSFEPGGPGVEIGSSTEAVGVGGWIMRGLDPGQGEGTDTKDEFRKSFGCDRSCRILYIDALKIKWLIQ